jgi:hypothetical protein
MANKDQKRGNRETRKPKQAKAKPAAQASSFITTSGGQSQSKPGRKS